MEDKITFEELYEAYLLCLKNKKNKFGTYNFVNEELCKNLIELMDKLNNRTYSLEESNCYVVTDLALREIYAAQFSDRIVQHFYMKEIEDILEDELVDGCCSCRKKRGTDYALKLLKKHLTEVSDYGKKDCYFMKIDLSGYFMTINRKQVSKKFIKIIQDKYLGKHKELLLYLTPIIFENNPALNCKYKCSEGLLEKVPERRKLKKDSDYGIAIGNLTAQAGSNLNLNDFDKYVINKLNLIRYIRYVDDIIIISDNKEELVKSFCLICLELSETNQKINRKKTKIDTAFHGVSFLGKITYPYGYQKPTKQVIIRTCEKVKILKELKKSKKLKENNIEARINSQLGTLVKYNCKKFIYQFYDILK